MPRSKGEDRGRKGIGLGVRDLLPEASQKPRTFWLSTFSSPASRFLVRAVGAVSPPAPVHGGTVVEADPGMVPGASLVLQVLINAAAPSSPLCFKIDEYLLPPGPPWGAGEAQPCRSPDIMGRALRRWPPEEAVPEVT